MQHGFWEWYHSHSAFLYAVIFGKGWFYLDFWSLVHTWSGVVVMILLASLRFRHRWFWLVFFLAAYEALEVGFVFMTLHIFRPEQLNDQAMDMLVGVAAALAANGFIRGRSRTLTRFQDRLMVMLFSSATFAFLAAGLACGADAGVPVRMNVSLLAMLSGAGTVFLLVWTNPKIQSVLLFLRLLLVALPYSTLCLLMISMTTCLQPWWPAIVPALPLFTASFYKWLTRQVKRAGMPIGHAVVVGEG